MAEIAPIEIDGRPIGPRATPYIIAELSANHGGEFERAKRIVQMAADAGADAIKFQAYTAGSLTLDCDMPGFTVEADNPWRGRRLHELYASAATPYEWFPELFAESHRLGITPFATPFDSDAVAMLEGLQAPAYKIASFEAIDHELIAACAATGRPMIISTGLCTEEETGEALETARSNGGKQVALLKCSSAYPSPLHDANLSVIPRMYERFGVPIGYSDHTLGPAAAVAACALGACIVEKHVIDSRQPPTADSEFSALPDELAQLVEFCRAAHEARGEPRMGPTEQEKQSLVFRRSIYASTDIAAGDTFSRDNIRSVRPGYGLAPKHLKTLLGRQAAHDIRRGEPIDWDCLAEKSAR